MPSNDDSSNIYLFIFQVHTMCSDMWSIAPTGAEETYKNIHPMIRNFQYAYARPWMSIPPTGRIDSGVAPP